MKHEQEEPMMTSRQMLREVYDKTNRIHNAVFGDEGADIPGISQRVNKLEDAEKKRGWWYMMIAAIAAGVSLTIKFIAEQINKL